MAALACWQDARGGLLTDRKRNVPESPEAQSASLPGSPAGRCLARLLPVLHSTGNFVSLQGPIVQGGRVEVRAIWPYQGVNLGVQPDLVKQAQVAQRPVDLALKDGAEINFTGQAVVKSDL